MTSKLTRERIEQYANDPRMCNINDEIRQMARMALAAMDSESGCLHLDYLQGHKDGLEWAAKLAEANHPDTGDWLYDDPIELAKAIRKGPDMPPVQPVADSEPVIVVGDDGGDALSYRRLIQSFEPGTKLYRNPQPAPVVPDELKEAADDFLTVLDEYPEQLVPINRDSAVVRALRASMHQSDNSPVIPDGYVLVPKEPTEAMCDISHIGVDVYCGITDDNEYYSIGGAEAAKVWKAMLAAAQQSPGSDPATVPGKWIPVSERIPDNTEPVLCIEKRADFGTYGQPFICWHDGGGWVGKTNYRLIVTHWMPLPAAPQEVKSE